MEQPRAKTNKISAVCRKSMKIGDNYYTLEYSEERDLSDFFFQDEDILKQERRNLWETCRMELVKQFKALEG